MVGDAADQGVLLGSSGFIPQNGGLVVRLAGHRAHLANDDLEDIDIEIVVNPLHHRCDTFKS